MSEEEQFKVDTFIEKTMDTYLKLLNNKYKDWKYTIKFDGMDVSQGVYFRKYQFKIKFVEKTKKFYSWDEMQKWNDMVIGDIYKFQKYIEMTLKDSPKILFSYTIDLVFLNESVKKKINFKTKNPKVKINFKSRLPVKDKEIIFDFIKFLEKTIPLEKDVLIDFQNKKESKMTTGVTESKHHIKVLCRGRMLIDILRTLAHEWVHELQHQKLKVKDKKDEIGGWSENQANAVSGAFVKNYASKNKKLEKYIYQHT